MPKRHLSLFLLLIFLVLPSLSWCIENEECLECHGESDFTTELDDGRTISLYVSAEQFSKSTHGDFDCMDCHEEPEPKDPGANFDHDPPLAEVNCSNCHDDQLSEILESVHGDAALKRNDPLAPKCQTCHGSHYILSPSNPKSHTYIMNIPTTCGRCHREGTEMTTTHKIDQKNVLENYSMSIHGAGLFKRGLTVSPSCVSCHGAHDILPHENAKSKINRANVSATCMTCHAEIERVHRDVIEGRLWEESPGRIPVCVECHSPHKVRKVIYNKPITDSTCLSCHSQPDLHMTKGSEAISLFINEPDFKSSVHANQSCISCHYDVHPGADPVCKDIEPVNCGVCHAKEVEGYSSGIHGKLASEKDSDAPSCTFCHGKHDMLSHEDSRAPTFARNSPELCARCHQEGQKAALRHTASETDIVQNYSLSIHGKGLIASGLVVTATCASCHTPHSELPAADPLSSVNPKNVAATCAECHFGINEQFEKSIHSPAVSSSNKKLPVCNDCHASHTINRVDLDDFKFRILSQCGDCHNDLTKAYFDTFHGKVAKLGEARAAKCHDCHGSHNILPQSNPDSMLHPDNHVETCRECHPGANRNFTGYLTHASHHDKDRYPSLYYTYWFMTFLLAGVFSFFGLHTILWFFRAFFQSKEDGEEDHPFEVPAKYKDKHVLRFRPLHSVLHLIVIISFMVLTLTGMTIKFPDTPLFQTLSRFLGGPEVTSVLHRLCAFLTFVYFFTHLFMVGGLWVKRRINLRGLISAEYSLVPHWRDVKEFWQHLLWFLRLGKEPKFGRWTYWEKFDYLAVFWGVAIIGVSGLILWFPEESTILLPGWCINIATIIHSDEALLAAGFIFTIHFFNTHFRPGKFPMDTVIFTGRLPVEEFIKERPREYQQLLESGKFEELLVDAPPRWLVIMVYTAGFFFLAVGLLTVLTIIYSLVFL